MDDEHCKGLLIEAIDLAGKRFPADTRLLVVECLLHTITDHFLKLLLIDARMRENFKEMIVDELARRHADDDVEEVLANA